MYEKILVMEADPQTRRFMGTFLEACKYECTLTDRWRIGLSILEENPPDMVVLDMMLKDCDSMAVLQKMREITEVPIIATSLKKGQDDRQMAAVLDGGADEYIIKPFHEKEFLARMRARFRRAIPGVEHAEPRQIFQMSYLTVDFDKRKVMVHDQAVHVTPIEYRLLSLLINGRGKVLTYESIDLELWGNHFMVNNPKIRVYIRAVRKKIQDDSRNPRFISTIPGIGYGFAAE